MKLVYTEECTQSYLEIDGKDLCNFTIEQKRDILKHLIDTAEDIDYMIVDFVENNDSSKFIRRCSDSGNDIYEYTLIV